MRSGMGGRERGRGARGTGEGVLGKEGWMVGGVGNFLFIKSCRGTSGLAVASSEARQDGRACNIRTRGGFFNSFGL